MRSFWKKYSYSWKYSVKNSCHASKNPRHENEYAECRAGQESQMGFSLGKENGSVCPSNLYHPITKLHANKELTAKKVMLVGFGMLYPLLSASETRISKSLVQVKHMQWDCSRKSEDWNSLHTSYPWLWNPDAPRENTALHTTELCKMIWAILARLGTHCVS